MIKGIGITVIIDEINNETSLTITKDALSSVLPQYTRYISAEKYTKLDDAYKLEFDIAITDSSTKEKQVYQLLQLAESIARPWTVYFDNEGRQHRAYF